MAVDEMYMENLDEFVNDENKVVTYKWLSLSLGVHVNQAKQMLYSFVQHQRNEKDKDDLNVLYLVAGVVEDSNGNKVHRVQIIPEESLDVTKRGLDPVSSCHVYSIQKTKPKDTNSLYTAEYDLVKEHLFNSNKHSAISHSSAVARSQDEIDRLREQTSSKGFEACSASSKNKANGTASAATKGSKSSGGIAGMFSAQKKEETKKDPPKASPTKHKTSPEKDNHNSKSKAKQGGVMSFFAKQAAKPKVEKKEEEKIQIDEDSDDEPKNTRRKGQKKESQKEVKKEPDNKAKKGRKNKIESDDEEDPVPQKSKRRRIQKAWESSSEEEEEEDMEEEPIPPTPPPPTRQPTPPREEESPAKKTKKESPKKKETEPSKHSEANHTKDKSDDTGTKTIRKKKLVSKTYVNDEGFMVTEKVYEDEEIEVKDEPKKPSPVKEAPKGKQQDKKKTPPKKAGPKAGGKQTNMMSFFKKA